MGSVNDLNVFMCGIAGILHFNRKSSGSDDKIRKMIDLLRHRGPDDVGFYEDEFVSLGHSRLSIIDLSSQGHQPMCNEDQSLWLTYNGEIYNYKELRKELENKSHHFKSNTDSEVIIHAYEEWGDECLKKFNGMWAFAIWDKKNKILFCSRDRFGEKPFYYYLDCEKIVFASEIKAILSILPEKPSLNEERCRNFLFTGRTETGTDTFYQKIYRIEPCSCFLLKIPDGLSVYQKKYWDFEINSLYDYTNRNLDEMSEEFFRLFEDSIKLRLQSDVPTGSCLSGGLDSGAIVCTINNLLKQNSVDRSQIGEHLKTFTACYNYSFCDESCYSHSIAEYSSSDEKKIFPKGDKLLQSLLKMLVYHDEPFPSLNVFSQWNVMELTSSNHIKVLMDGQGGDELLAGYLPYIRPFLFDLISKKHFGKALKEYLSFFDIIPYSPLLRILKKIFSKILNFEINSSSNPYISFVRNRTGVENERFDFRKLLKKNILGDSVPELVRYEDRNSMAFSIETRLPFLDYRLVEFVFSLPLNYIIQNGWTKFLLRNAMRNKMPEHVRQRRQKLGFATPETIWLDENKKDILELFSNTRKRYSDYLLDRTAILRDIKRLLRPEHSNSIKTVTRYMIFDLWLTEIYKQ